MRYLSLLALLLVSQAALSQQNPQKCGWDYVQQTIEDHYGSYTKHVEEMLEHLAPFIDSSLTENNVFRIPVVFHVMYETPEDNISRAQILNALDVLNRDYRRRNADTTNTRPIFKGVAADTEIEFVLAKRDPQGNCHEGITRTFTTLTAGANNNVKPLSNWDNRKYMNVWVVRSINLNGQTNVLGYAYFPFPNQSFVVDGIVIRHDQMGEIGTAVAGGRTLVHEAGHYFALQHTFNEGCFVGDNCADTPPVAEANFGCPLNSNSCSNDIPDLPDQIENYMDYANDPCTNMFTTCQKNTMRGSILAPNLRGMLVTSANATVTGIAPNQALPCAPMADFTQSEQVICEGQTIQFTDLTYMGNPTSYLWTFSGGTPSSSTDVNPLVTYSQAGNYDATLSVNNANGGNGLWKIGTVSVRSASQTPNQNAFFDDFEMYPIPNNNWHVTPGIDTNNFKYTQVTSFGGQTCVTLQNFNALRGEADEMTSPMISLYNASQAILTFRLAFAHKTLGNNDRLEIAASNDCGLTWTTISTRTGITLRSTSIVHATPWWPTTAAEWRTIDVDLNNYIQQPNPMMFKLRFVNGGGNNLYIDEMMLNATIDVQETNLSNNIVVYPNPANDVFVVESPSAISNIYILDISGRKVQHLKGNGQTKIEVPVGISAGMYFLHIQFQNGETVVRKIEVSK